jgi:hypothetical protein
MHTKFWPGNFDGKRTFGRLRCRWEDNIIMDIMEIVWEDVSWMDMAQDRYK